MRSGARRSDSAGAEGAGARPVAAPFSITRRRSTRAASEPAPTTSAPRNGTLRDGAEHEGYGFGFMDDSVMAGAMSGTAMDFFPLPLSRCGIYSSSTAWKLVPPNPKALRPARRMLSAGTVQGFNSVLT